MTFKFEYFSKNKMNALYLTEITITDCLQALDEYWYERDTLFSGEFDSWLEFLFQY